MLGLGNEDVDKLIAWRDDKNVTFPMLLSQDTYDAYVPPEGDPYALDVVTGKQGNIRYMIHGAQTPDLVALFEQLLGE